MNADEVDAITARVASFPPQKQVDFVLGMLEKVADERDRLQTICDAVGAESIVAIVDERDRLRAGIMTAEVHGGMIVRMRESVWLQAEAERNRLRTVVDAAGAPPGDDLATRVQAIVASRDKAEGDGFAMHDEIEEENTRLRALVDGDDRLWAHVVMQIMLTIDGGRRTWGDPLAGQVISAVADLETERDRLRAVVDALREHRALVARLIEEDHEPEEEIGLDEAQWASWRRITEMLDQLDVSPTGEDT